MQVVVFARVVVACGDAAGGENTAGDHAAALPRRLAGFVAAFAARCFAARWASGERAPQPTRPHAPASDSTSAREACSSVKQDSIDDMRTPVRVDSRAKVAGSPLADMSQPTARGAAALPIVCDMSATAPGHSAANRMRANPEHSASRWSASTSQGTRIHLRFIKITGSGDIRSPIHTREKARASEFYGRAGEDIPAHVRSRRER